MMTGTISISFWSPVGLPEVIRKHLVSPLCIHSTPWCVPWRLGSCQVTVMGEFWSGGGNRVGGPGGRGRVGGRLAPPHSPGPLLPLRLSLNSYTVSIIYYTNISYHNRIILYHLPTHTLFTPFGGQRIKLMLSKMRSGRQLQKVMLQCTYVRIARIYRYIFTTWHKHSAR